jgi:protein tyrosine phosphatase
MILCNWDFTSDGVGRTGTFIGLDLLVDEAHDSKKSGHQTIKVMRCVHNMRLQRTQMVQTAVSSCYEPKPGGGGEGAFANNL